MEIWRENNKKSRGKVKKESDETKETKRKNNRDTRKRKQKGMNTEMKERENLKPKNKNQEIRSTPPSPSRRYYWALAHLVQAFKKTRNKT